jgi:hypothetical protein
MAHRALRKATLQRGLWRAGCGDNSHVRHSPDGLPRRHALSYRDVEELLAERGIDVDHVSVYRWVQRFTPLLIDAARPCRHAPEDGGSGMKHSAPRGARAP